MMHGRGKSDCLIVPRKPPNKAAVPAAEAVEGRGQAKGNSHQQNAPRTQCRAHGASSALERIRQAARRDRKQRFTAIFHHVYDFDRLRSAFYAIKRDADRGRRWRDVADVPAGPGGQLHFRPARVSDRDIVAVTGDDALRSSG